MAFGKNGCRRFARRGRRRKSVDYAKYGWYCEIMKNVTVSLDDETYRRARVKAAEAGRSLSSVVREQLYAFSHEETEFDRLARMQQELFAEMDAKGGGLTSSDLMSRDELYNERFKKFDERNRK